MNDYDAGENPMIIYEYWDNYIYDRASDYEKWAYLEDIAWQDEEDRRLGL